jgi:hypothetical protein
MESEQKIKRTGRMMRTDVPGSPSDFLPIWSTWKSALNVRELLAGRVVACSIGHKQSSAMQPLQYGPPSEKKIDAPGKGI